MHFHGIPSSNDSGVCPKASRNFLEAFFFRLRTSPRSITTLSGHGSPHLFESAQMRTSGNSLPPSPRLLPGELRGPPALVDDEGYPVTEWVRRNVFPISWKACERRVERSTRSTRTFVRRTSTHVNALGPHRQHLDPFTQTGGFPVRVLDAIRAGQRGRPIFLISTMAMHTQNLQADPRASLFVTEPDASGDPLGLSRVTLLGMSGEYRSQSWPPHVRPTGTRYPNSKYWVDYEDLFRVDVVDVYYVGGFGVMGWIPAADYSEALSDPLAELKAASCST